MDPVEPLLGPDFTDSALLSDPYGEFGRLRERAPLVRARYLDGSPVWYVTRAEQVREVLSEPRFMTSPPDDAVGGNATDQLVEAFGVPPELACYIGGSLQSSDGQTHSRLRKLVSRMFTARRVAELRPSVEQIVRGTLDDLERVDGPVDLVESFCYSLPITVICDLVGVPEADRSMWRRWGASLAEMSESSFATTLREVDDYLRSLIGTRRARPEADLLSGLIAVRDEDGDTLSEPVGKGCSCVG